MSEIKPAVLDLSKQLKTHLKIDKNGAGTADEHTYISTLPEDISAETVRRVNEHNANFAAAAVHRFGEESIHFLKKHDDIDRTSVEIPIVGKDTMGITFQREKEVSAGIGENAGKKTVFGAVSRNWKTNAADKAGSMGVVLSLLSKEAQAAFEKETEKS